MGSKHISYEYSGLSSTDKCRLLCYIGNRLTAGLRFRIIDNRNSPELQKTSRSYIELYHKIFTQMASVIEEDPQVYPDNLFIDIMTELAADGNFGAEFTRAWEDGFKYISHDDRS